MIYNFPGALWKMPTARREGGIVGDDIALHIFNLQLS